jgi:hypothetical protein
MTDNAHLRFGIFRNIRNLAYCSPFQKDDIDDVLNRRSNGRRARRNGRGRDRESRGDAGGYVEEGDGQDLQGNDQHEIRLALRCADDGGYQSHRRS